MRSNSEAPFAAREASARADHRSQYRNASCLCPPSRPTCDCQNNRSIDLDATGIEGARRHLAAAKAAYALGAKLGGTALLAWLFQLIQPALLRLAWFARLYGRWSAWKAELLAWLRTSAPWRAARLLRRQWLRLRRRWAE